MRGRKLRLLAALLGTLLSMTLLGPVAPSNATGGADIIVYGDGVWRSTYFDMTDYGVPAACPGPTTQTVRVRLEKMATSSRLYIRNVRIVNLTSRNLKNVVDWTSRGYNAAPLGVTWGYNVEKTLRHPVNNSLLNVNVAWSNGLAVQTLAFGTDGGTGCTPNFSMKFHRY